MLMYHLFYSVQNSKNGYSETKAFLSEKEAQKEAIKLCICDNVKIVTIRCIDVKSINLSVYKKPDKFEINESYEDFTFSPEIKENLEVVNATVKK